MVTGNEGFRVRSATETRCARVAARLGLRGDHADVVGRAAELHDIGKVAVPDAILDKPAGLDAADGEEIPLAARVVAVCDAYEATVGERAYRFLARPGRRRR